ncbi:MAG TPA: hypothetical protein VFR04_01265 [Solirubrobacterales bacterium]|nr:hypothetical protein [Solirubrobacterales bacterium]
MTRKQGRRVRLGSLLALALGAVAIFVLPGLASARNSDDDGASSSATIRSFDPATKTLVVALPDDQTVSGVVTRRTKIRCEDQSGHHGRHGRDEVREREAEPGDDRGGREAEPGDDHGGDSSGPGPSHSGPSGHDDNGRGANCTVADLVPGAAVEEIELEFRRDTVVFDEVELDD